MRFKRIIEFEDLRKPFGRMVGGRRIDKALNYSAEVEIAEIFSIIGSAGFLEIGAFPDSGQKILKTKIGEIVTIKK